MASESTAHSAFGLMGYWLTAYLGSKSNCEILYQLNISLPITLSQQLPYWAYVTSFSPTGLFLGTF